MDEVMTVEVLLFARLRELTGARSVRVGVRQPATPDTVWEAVVAAHPAVLGARPSLRVAVNERYARWDAALSDGDVVAFIPPVAGGADRTVDARITADELDARALEAVVLSDADGAVCTFSGVVRDHHEGRTVSRLEYEAYPAMAEAAMRSIGEEALRRSGARAIALWHRIGVLQVGETSVVVTAGAAHRDAAFEACRYAIDTLKAEAPIWKKEHGPAGAAWVEEPPVAG